MGNKKDISYYNNNVDIELSDLLFRYTYSQFYGTPFCLKKLFMLMTFCTKKKNNNNTYSKVRIYRLDLVSKLWHFEL